MINSFIPKKNSLIISRAATAIYLILKSRNIIGQKVIVPANICYAAVYPIIYSGNQPVFCDVDPMSGNVTYDLIKDKLDGAAAVILPHMYGNPVADIKRICGLCRSNSIISIEDCASAMGAETSDGICGSFGDFVLYSTGYSKTIDLGYGGILASDNDLSLIKAMYGELPLRTDADEANEAFFSKLYRLIRNDRAQSVDKYIWAALSDKLQPVFVHRLGISEEDYLKEIDRLPDIIEQRRSEKELYRKLLSDNIYITPYEYEEGAVPWRYCFFVPAEDKTAIVKYLLDNIVPVSDWYPDVTPIFGCSCGYAGAGEMESRILNFPLMIGEEKIRRICGIMNSYQQNKGVK